MAFQLANRITNNQFEDILGAKISVSLNVPEGQKIY